MNWKHERNPQIEDAEEKGDPAIRQAQLQLIIVVENSLERGVLSRTQAYLGVAVEKIDWLNIELGKKGTMGKMVSKLGSSSLKEIVLKMGPIPNILAAASTTHTDKWASE